MSGPAKCERRYCGLRLEERHDRMLGRLTLVCPGCERNARGLCRDCPATLPPVRSGSRPMRCRPCAAKRADARRPANDRKRYERKRAAILRQQKARRATPEGRKKERAYKQAYHKEYAQGEWYVRWKRAYQRRRYANDPELRERKKAQMRARRLRIQAAARQGQAERAA